MAGLLQQLSGNPLATVIGQKIEQATDQSLAAEDWALNMEICDMINDTDEGPRDAVRAIKKRFQQNAGKNHTSVMYTLTVLETCVKNCGRRFHMLITSKDFINDLVKLIGPKNDPPAALQEKVLSLIQTWADAFKSQPDLQGVYHVYVDLKTKGIEFPMTDLDTMAPIHTPSRTITQPPASQSPAPIPHGTPTQVPAAARQALPNSQSTRIPSGPIRLSPEQMAKLRSELDVVQGNMRVFAEMLGELSPGKEHDEDWELIRDLSATCQAMQKRIVELIEKVANEEVTNELLRINDDLNNLFVRYDRFVKKKTGTLVKGPEKNVERKAETSLIDLGEEAGAVGGAGGVDLLAGRLQATSLSRGPAEAEGADDFDVFAQTRSSIDEGKARGSSYADNSSAVGEQSSLSLGQLAQNRAQPDVAKAAPKDEREQEFDEMERWLQSEPGNGNAPNTASIANSDFERFLAERAVAAEALPNQSPKRPEKSADPFGL